MEQLDKQTFIRRKARDNLDNPDGTRVYWSRHAMTEMVQNQLTRSVVETALQACEVIEDDPATHCPLPNCLVLGYLQGMPPIHAVGCQVPLICAPIPACSALDDQSIVP